MLRSLQRNSHSSPLWIPTCNVSGSAPSSTAGPPASCGQQPRAIFPRDCTEGPSLDHLSQGLCWGPQHSVAQLPREPGEGVWRGRWHTQPEIHQKSASPQCCFMQSMGAELVEPGWLFLTSGTLGVSHNLSEPLLPPQKLRISQPGGGWRMVKQDDRCTYLSVFCCHSSLGPQKQT